VVEHPCCKIEQTGSSGSYTYSVASDYANRPVNYVSYWDSGRSQLAHNGQPTGAPSCGATGKRGVHARRHNGDDGGAIQRNMRLAVAVAARMMVQGGYCKGGSSNAGYWDYPTGNRHGPRTRYGRRFREQRNYFGNPYPIDSGKYTTLSRVPELREFLRHVSTRAETCGNGMKRLFMMRIRLAGLRGGSYYSSTRLRAACVVPLHGDPRQTRQYDVGFRVVEVPEPAMLMLLVLGGWRWRGGDSSGGTSRVRKINPIVWFEI